MINNSKIKTLKSFKIFLLINSKTLDSFYLYFRQIFTGEELLSIDNFNSITNIILITIISTILFSIFIIMLWWFIIKWFNLDKKWRILKIYINILENYYKYIIFYNICILNILTYFLFNNLNNIDNIWDVDPQIIKNIEKSNFNFNSDINEFLLSEEYLQIRSWLDDANNSKK